jgi:hypothetical protein
MRRFRSAVHLCALWFADGAADFVQLGHNDAGSRRESCQSVAYALSQTVEALTRARWLGEKAV